MDVSSAITASAIGLEVQKKAQDIQANQVLKVLESTSQQTQQAASQKTGIGSHLNISA